MKGIKFDFTNMFYPNIEKGIKYEEINEYKEKIEKIISEILEEEPGFLKLLKNTKYLDKILDIQEWIQSFENFVVLGIGVQR
nr:hypothetical protein [Marinitoga lauensis]